MDRFDEEIFDPQGNITEVRPRNRTDRRNRGRVRQESVACTLGRVLDLSATGMRIQCRRAPKKTVRVELMDGRDRIGLHAEPVWSRRTGLFRREVGLRFVDLDADTAERLTRMSMTNRVRHFTPHAA